MATPNILPIFSVAIVLIGSAASSSFLTPSSGAGHALEASATDLVTLIATGQLPSAAIDSSAPPTLNATAEAMLAPLGQNGREDHSMSADDVLGMMHEYEARLRQAEDSAEDSYRSVVEKEEGLQHEFEPTMAGLQESIRAAADQAGKAEAVTMAERLKSTHYRQTAALDRSASFWERRLASERELIRQAAAKNRLEEASQLSLPGRTEHLVSQLVAVRTEEKTRLDDWLRNVTDGLMEKGA